MKLLRSAGQRIGNKPAIALVILWSLFPLYWAAKTSLTTLASAEGRPPKYIPAPFTISNYKALFGIQSSGADIAYQFGRSLVNSTVESGGAMILTILIAVTSAYAFARLHMRFKGVIFASVIGTLLLPAYATLIPVYRMMSGWGLVNTYFGVILAYTAGFVPLAMWILYTYFQSIPAEIEEAAAVDGASALRTLIRIVIPLSAPGIASAAIITFMLGWTQFLFPLVLTSDLSSQPVTVIVAALNGQRVVPFTLLMGAAALAAAPPGIFALIMNRRIVQGLTAGGVK